MSQLDNWSAYDGSVQWERAFPGWALAGAPTRATAKQLARGRELALIGQEVRAYLAQEGGIPLAAVDSAYVRSCAARDDLALVPERCAEWAARVARRGGPHDPIDEAVLAASLGLAH